MIPENTVRVVLDGTLVGGEVFAHGQDFDNLPSPTDQTAMDAFAEMVFARWKDTFLVTAVRALFGPATFWTRARVYTIGPAGKAVVEAVSVGAALNGQGSSALPNQVSFVVTKLTGAPGRANRGRAYLPGLAQGAIGTDGQMSSANIALLVNAYASWLEAVHADATNPGVAVVSSSVKGANRLITDVSGDSRFDVQRRRANKQTIDNKHSTVVSA